MVPSYWGQRGLHWLFSFVQVFSILFALPAIGILDLFRRPDDSCCADLKRTTEVEEGKDPLSNKGLSSQVQFADNVLVCWMGGGA